MVSRAGPDYLPQFLHARVVIENTLRHGFAPESQNAEADGVGVGE